MKADTRLLSIAVLTAAGLAADAFHQPLIKPIPSRLRAQDRVRNTIHFSSINDDVSSDIDALESELAAEIEAALELAQQAIEGSTEEGLDEVANLLLEAPPNLIPAPPEDVPTESVISSVLDDEPEDIIEEVEEAQKQPLPPTTPPPPPPQTISFGETLQKAAMEEAEKLKKLLFGIKEDISETEARVEEAKGTADALKLEIEASIKERDETVKTIESEFAAEKERLAKEIGTASEDLQSVIDESTKNIADAQSEAARADEALVSKMDSLASAIKEITSEVIGTKKEKEEIQETKPSRLNKVVQEAKENMLGVKKSIEFDKTYMNRVNADLVQMAEEAESKVKEAYDAAAIIRNERVSLQDQIDTVERSSLSQIAELEDQLVEDDAFYAKLLESERARVSKVIDDAYKKYGEIVGKEEAKRKSVEADYATQLSQKEKEGRTAIDAIEAKVNDKLDALEAKHSKERIGIYQQKIEAVAAERDVMLADLAVESAKLETVRAKMDVKLNRVRTDVVGVKAAFEQELKKRRLLAEEERQELLGRIEDVRSDMTNKIIAQQESMETQKSAYIDQQDAAIVKSEEECRQAWSELATLKQTLNDTNEEKSRMEGTVADKAALIESYENDRTSFRKSVRLSFKVAREKIGSKAKRVIGKDDK
mmetsp:Transcript_13888/g.28321  ORF Transcript_13888/g.28321 Transcript_13888/m.28321 type:complete len:654 (-) Transcript_13888:91-2052(-)|eukprot:CAMPEP_0113426850 /NCGR_PEP_ID=MMETSP0013_2-20120614/30966_1 /TAXON_ID=2843 ORGANISM="Skeletonema costatum, Strain 1716" /NCGR_SAMPLE_ID=MMETSP0013_2 /ASSEMBLY_ACC=CAM_ASM_000158 /LENGTH=653 /DNA_ID=CAMNT_0000315193 /DNA_START=30 /DNA_END=1991 /DNA_ORIENTATION=+ /assembly_acc=CAM_ASM_000158